jgi:acyl dehydratase
MRLGLALGDCAEFARTIGDADLILCAALTGDFDPLHLDEAYARGTAFGRRIAHGALVLGLCSTTASRIAQRSIANGAEGVPVSVGYESVRFLRPAFVGDTLTARYVVEALDEAAARSESRIEVANGRGETLLAGRHVMRWVPLSPSPAP